MNNLVYEDTAKYDFWLKSILGGVLALTFILGVILISENIGAALAMFGVTLFDVLLFKAILPLRFQILGDRLKIVLGGPFTINIPFSNIKDVRSASGNKAFAYRGLRFATAILTRRTWGNQLVEEYGVSYESMRRIIKVGVLIKCIPLGEE